VQGNAASAALAGQNSMRQFNIIRGLLPAHTAKGIRASPKVLRKKDHAWDQVKFMI
jgi:hypothetical protein